MFMVWCVIDDPDQMDQVLEAFEVGGITGATIIESTGLGRTKKKHIPLRYYYAGSEQGETDNLTLFTIVPDMITVNKCQSIIESVVGDLNLPNTGVFAAWELDHVKGVPSHPGEKDAE